MMNVKDKFGFNIGVADEYLEKLSKKNPSLDLEIITSVLLTPDSVFISSNARESRCYYKAIDNSTPDRWYKLVVKYIVKTKEHWLTTGHKTDGIRETEVFNENTLQ